jgi:Flp pilus assembly protein TadD
MMATASLVIHADIAPQSQSGEIQLQLGHEFFRDGRYGDALDAYQRALKTPEVDPRAARTGVVLAALRVAEFTLARETAEALAESAPTDPEAMALHGDALWAAGLFEEAETQYRAALALAPDSPRGRHGNARALAAKSRLDEAMAEAQAALRLSPRDLEIHHTVGAIYERMRKYEEAAGAFTNYVNLLPNKDTSDKADWSRSEIKFLRSFGPIGERQGRGPSEGQRRRAPGLRRRHRRREHDPLGAHGAPSWRHSDYLYPQRRSWRRRPARVAARAHQLPRAGGIEAAERTVSRQGSAAQKPTGS